MSKLYKAIVVCSLWWVGLQALHAQQDLMITQYMTNLLPTNPGYAGTNGQFNAMALTRHQWVGFEGAPQSNVLVINSPFLKHNIGVGFTLMHDKIGPIQQTMVYADFAYNINLTARTKLSFGMKAGMNLQQPDLSGLQLLEPNDPAFNAPKEIELNPNFGFGLYLYSDKYYAGISTPRLIKNAVGTEPGQVQVEGEEERHYFLIGGYVFDINEQLKLRPSVMAKFVNNAPPSVDISLMAIYLDRFWLGTTVRPGDAWAFITQYQLTKPLRLGYSYDITFNRLSSASSGTHEIMLSYDMVFRPNKIVTTRYF